MAFGAKAHYTNSEMVIDVYSYEGYQTADSYRFRFLGGRRYCSRKERIVRARYVPLAWSDVPAVVREKLWEMLRELEEAALQAQDDFDEAGESMADAV